jgi:hypothetical protein
MIELDDEKEYMMLKTTCLKNTRTNFEKEKEGMEIDDTKVRNGFQ